MKVHKNTVHAGAYSTTQEDIGWLGTNGLRIDNVDNVDNVDVETALIAREIDKARKQGKLVPELSILMHVEDQVAEGKPLVQRGHELSSEKAQTNARTMLENLFGTSLSQISFVKPEVVVPIVEARFVSRIPRAMPALSILPAIAMIAEWIGEKTGLIPEQSPAPLEEFIEEEIVEKESPYRLNVKLLFGDQLDVGKFSNVELEDIHKSVTR